MDAGADPPAEHALVDELIGQINAESAVPRGRVARVRRVVTARRVLGVVGLVIAVAVTWPFAPVLAVIVGAVGMLGVAASLIFAAPAGVDVRPSVPSRAPGAPPIVGGPVTGSSPNALWPAGGPESRG